MRKRKIAILGGGMSGLAAAYELTKTEELQAKHEVTIYQMGWRLGGKCASGRNRDVRYGRRIEEHGLHVWFGFYENAFELLRDAYEHLNPAPNEAIRTWEHAVRKHSNTPIGVSQALPWQLVNVPWPENADQPGDGRLFLTPWGAVTEVVSMLELVVRAILDRLPTIGTISYVVKSTVKSVLGALIPGHDDEPAPRPPHHVHAAELLDGLELAKKAAKALSQDPAKSLAAHAQSIEDVLWEIFEELEKLVLAVLQPGPVDPVISLALEVMELGAAMMTGILSPKWGVLEHFDLERVDHLELREWLVECGCSKDVAYHGNALRAFYDTAFAYEDGSRFRPNMAAGTAARAILRIVATYKGAVLYLLNAGMGETVVSPIYRVLKQRGVKIEFFHKVKKLELTETKSYVGKVHFALQAVPKASYQPLWWTNDLWCWPSEPFWEQLEDGEALRQKGLNFESGWCNHEAGRKTIEFGKDFDEVVLAIPLGGFKRLNGEPTMLDELYEANPALVEMQDALGLVPSQSLQLWANDTLEGLGYPGPKPAAVGAPEYLSIWADMTQQLRHEDWGPAGPRSLHYWCGVLDTDLYRAKSTDETVPARAKQLVVDEANRWFGAFGRQVWPKAAEQGILSYSTLYAASPAAEEPALFTQYVRQNVDPTECCVLSPKGSTTRRLGPADSGFINLWLTGDWTRTGMNTASVEGAIMSGKATSRAICGSPKRIVGEDFFRKADADRARVPPSSSAASPIAPSGGAASAATDAPAKGEGFHVHLHFGDDAPKGDSPKGDAPGSDAPKPAPAAPAQGSGLPTYVSDHGHGEQCSLPPGMVADARVSVFTVSADAKTLQATVDRFLNAPSNGAVHYSVLSVPGFGAAPVMFSFTAAKRLYSVPEVTGWVPDHEFAAWVILLRREPGALLPKIVFWNPYILLDTYTGAITGREIWGFRKQLAQVKAPPMGGPNGPLVFEVSALTFQTFSQQTQGKYQPLVWLDGVSPLGGHRLGTCEEVTEALIGTITNGSGHVAPLLGSFDPFHLKEHLDLTRVRITNLKQFRDAVDPTKACYQALVEAFCVPQKIHGFGLYTGGQVSIREVASHQIVADLGLSGPRVPILTGMYLDFDFTADPGELIWESTARR